MNVRFLPMVPVSAILADNRLTLNALRVLLALYQFADKDGGCYPTRTALAQMCKLPERKINAATAKLVELGWLRKDGNGGRGKATRYTITPPETLPKTGTLSNANPAQNGHPLPPKTLPKTDKVSGETLPKTGTLLEPETLPVSVQKPCPKRAGAIEHTNNIPVPAPDKLEREARATRAPAQEPAFELQSKPQRKPAKRVSIACPPEVEPDDWQELLAICKAKRKPMTARVWAGMVAAAEHDGMTPQEMVELCIKKGWARYETGWKANEERKQNGSGYKSVWQRREEEAQKWIKPKPKTPHGVIIDVTPANREQFTLLEKTK